MAWAFVNSTSKKLGQNGGTTTATDFSTGGPATSFYLWVTYDIGGAVANTDITNSVSGAGVNPIALTAQNSSTTGGGRWFYYENVTGSSTMTFTVSKVNSFSAIIVYGFSGGATSSSFSAEDGKIDNNTATTETPTNAISCAATDLVLFGLQDKTNSAAPTYPAGYTGTTSQVFAGGSNYETAACYKLSPSATEQPTFIFTSIDKTCCAIASFLQASGGATRPVKMAGAWGGYAGESGGFAG